MIVKLLTEHHLEFLSLEGGYRGSSESTLVKIPHCWKSHALAQISLLLSILYATVLTIIVISKLSYNGVAVNQNIVTQVEKIFMSVIIF